MTPEAMRRLADLQIEKQFGIRAGDGKPREMAAPEPAQPTRRTRSPSRTSRRRRRPRRSRGIRAGVRTAHDRAEHDRWRPQTAGTAASGRDARRTRIPAGPLEAIALYDRLLTEYPNYEHSDKVLYQKARAYDELGRTEEAIADHGAPDRREPAFRALRRSAVQARRVLLHAPAIPRRRDRLLGDHQPGRRIRRTTNSRSTSSAGRSTSRTSTRRPCTSTWRCSTTRCRSATTSIRRTRRTTSAASPIRSESSA